MFQSLTQKSRNLSDHKESIQTKEYRDRLLDSIYQLIQQIQENEVDQDQQFYDRFKNQVSHQQIADLLSQLQMNNKFKQTDKYQSVRILTNMSNILKSLGSQSIKIQVKINSSLFNVQRDTLRLIQDIYDTYLIVEHTGSCGRESILMQLDLQIRKLDQHNFFWENISSLENRTKSITKENFKSIDIISQIDLWINMIKLQTPPKIIERQIEVQGNKTSSKDQQLKEAHEYYAGLGRDKDQLAALQIYQNLASQGNTIALTIMGQLMQEGIICSQDFDQAFEYFKASAEKCNTFGLFNAGKLILDGKVFDKIYEHDSKANFSKQTLENDIRGHDCMFAIAMLKKAAEQDHINSMIYLGDLYSKGLTNGEQIIEIDYSSAEYYFKLAKSKNSTIALFKLAQLYQTMSKESLYRNRSQLIIPLFNQAKNLDYLPAFYELAQIQLLGIDGEFQPNPQMADLIFEQGAMKGDKRCVKKIIALRMQSLLKGDYIFDDYIDMLDQFDEIYKDQSLTYYNRGKLYFKGIKVEKNVQKAIEYFRIGASKGCQKCKAQLDQLKKEKQKNFETNIEHDQTEKDENPTFKSQQSSKVASQKSPSNGFISQIKQSDWKKQFKKPGPISNQQNKSNFSNQLEPNDSSTIQPDRHTRLTISIIKPQDQQQNDRKRGASDYTGLQPTLGLEKSILLSQLKIQVPSPTNQNQYFSSPRNTPLISPTTSSRKERFQFSRNPSQTSSKYLLHQ